MRKIKFITAVMLCCTMLAACQKAIIDEEQTTTENVKIVFNISSISKTPFPELAQKSRATVDISKVCTRISIAAFKAGEKVKGISQTLKDKDFGSPAISLPKGTYHIVIVAHSGAGAATITAPEKIKFANNKVTDTFCYYGEITVDQPRQQDITLQRAVAMFKLEILDPMPESVSQMVFKYTGGSSTFDVVSGYGCVKSKETETREVTTAMHGKSTSFCIYTFQRRDSNTLNIHVSAQDKSGNELLGRDFSDVEIKTGWITPYTGNFFDKFEDAMAKKLTLKADTAWSVSKEIKY